MRSFLWMSKYSIVYMYHNFFIRSSVDGHLGGFHVPGVVNSAAVNHGIYVSLSILVSLGYMPRSGIAGSYGGFPYCSWGSQGKNTEVVCHSLLQWTTFYQTSPP